MPRLVPARLASSSWRRGVLLGLGAVAGLALGAAARPLAAQGSLSLQGFGYPTGQLSTRALGTGGALGEFDPVSALNPATVGQFFRPTFSVQYDPEFRTVTGPGGASAGTTTARFPVIAAGVPARWGIRIGASASTLLDRSFTTEYRSTTQFSDGPVASTDRVESRGAISDLRFGVGRYFGRRLGVGLAAHVYTGENRVVSARAFDDTVRFGPTADSSTIGFRGGAFSVGADLLVVRGVSLAASYRQGGAMRTERRDTTLTRADAPSRIGASLRVDRITGAIIAASWARTTWSDLQGLGTPNLRAVDADELRLGVEAVGPRLGDAPVQLRLGGFQRGLPFGVAGADVRETGFAGGVGIPLGGGRALVDLGLQRAARSARGGNATALAGLQERAWTLSVGATVRP